MNEPASDPTYSYKPRLMGPSYDFRLTREALDWQIGSRSGRVAFPMIRRIRLGYKPTNLATARFIAEIWPANSPKLLLGSTSAKSIIDLAAHNDEYRAFVNELHRRIAATNSECVFEGGFPAWRWWPAAIIGVLALAGIIYVAFKGIVSGHLFAAIVIVVTGLWFAWQIWNIVMRNRPRRYSPDAIPEDLLPRR